MKIQYLWVSQYLNVYVDKFTMKQMIACLKNKNIQMEIGIYANLYVPKISNCFDPHEDKLFKVNDSMKASLSDFSIREHIQKSIDGHNTLATNFESARSDLGVNYVDKWIKKVWEWADDNNIPILSTDEPLDYRDESYWVGLGRNKKQFLTTRIINLER